MKKNILFLLLCTLLALPAAAQIFNFSLPTNSRQLLDEALAGAIVKVTQSYELCDPANGDRYGSEGKDYYNKVSFVGVRTTRGILVPAAAETPWDDDEDYEQYIGVYDGALLRSSYTTVNTATDESTAIPVPLTVYAVDDQLSFLCDSLLCDEGLPLDSVAGEKQGWMVWLSTTDLQSSDSLRMTSIATPLTISAKGEPIMLTDVPTQETLCGGIYVVPTQTAIGQITLCLAGYAVATDDRWQLRCPFVAVRHRPSNRLTPINPRDSEEAHLSNGKENKKKK